MKVLKTFIAFLFLALGTSMSLNAQNREVSGQVLDTEQYPIIGAAVIYSGTGAVTDIDGNFTVTVPAGTVELEVSCMGYVTKKVAVPDTQSNITVILDLDQMLIEETVVVGYGTQKKVNLTGAISVVDDDALKDRSSHNLVTMLQGSVPGLNISTQSGNPGSSGKLNIRGFTSINQTDPIVLIDGAIGDLEDVNPNDVQSISVIKDAAAAAVYGARAAYGVILVTTKSGSDDDGKAKIRYSGKFGWEEPTTSTDYEDRGYWSVLTLDTFWATQKSGTKYTRYTDQDMIELLARVNDKTENPARPWIKEEVRNGRNQYVYYGNYDWYHELFRDQHPVQQHNISISGGSKNIKYFISGGFDHQTGIMKINPDVYKKYNLRAKIDAKLNKIMRFSNNSAFYNSAYTFVGLGNPQNIFQQLRHVTAAFPLVHPDGTYPYENNPMLNSSTYRIGNARHIVMMEGKDKNIESKFNFANTSELTITPIEQLSVVANFTYRRVYDSDIYRLVPVTYSAFPGETAVSQQHDDKLTENTSTRNYLSGNVFATYEDTFKENHNLKIMAGFNAETYHRKDVDVTAYNLTDVDLMDFRLVGTDASGAKRIELDGSQNEYALMGFFGRVNYDYKGRYLIEASGRYDGSSRFAKGHRWGLFPSVSAGWRISEENWFAPAKEVVNNLKLRASFGSLGNQNVGYYDYLRLVTITNIGSGGYTFGEGTTLADYSNLSAPNSSALTWETTEQYNVGLDASLFDSRLNLTAEAYIRDTKDMLVQGGSLPSVYGADSPKENSAELRTRGYELSISWRDQFMLAGKPFGYSVSASLSDYDSHITRYDNNPEKLLSDYYEGMRIGDIWGFEVDGLFATDDEAAEYQNNVCDALTYIKTLSDSDRMVGGFRAGDLRYVDLDNDGSGPNGINQITIGKNTANDPGDRKIIGNWLPSMQYGFNLSFDWAGFDVSAFFQGLGNTEYYPAGNSFAFWGSYSYPYYSAFLPRNFMSTVWSEDNPDAYFPRPRVYSSTGGELRPANTRYLQNIAYLRFKNLTVGYTLPEKWTKAIHIEKVRFYFSGENLAYWSPLKKYTKYLDPESISRRTLDQTSDGIYKGNDSDFMAYPWQKTFMFGIDITF